MEIEFYGANCFKIKTKQAIIVVDDNLEKIGAKTQQSDKTVAIYTNQHLQEGVSPKSRLVLDDPGEFEVGDVTITGVQARGHMDEEGVETATVYQFMFAGQTVTVLGHVHPEVSAEVLELAGGSEVLIVPVGGNGYTLDPVGAASVIKKVEPGVVIPAQYAIKGLNYEVPAQALEEFTKIMPASGEGPQDSYNLAKEVPTVTTGQTKIIVLNRLEK